MKFKILGIYIHHFSVIIYKLHTYIYIHTWFASLFTWSDDFSDLIVKSMTFSSCSKNISWFDPLRGEDLGTHSSTTHRCYGHPGLPRVNLPAISGTHPGDSNIFNYYKSPKYNYPTWKHLAGSHPKRKLVFEPSIFRCYVSFREGNTSFKKRDVLFCLLCQPLQVYIVLRFSTELVDWNLPIGNDQSWMFGSTLLIWRHARYPYLKSPWILENMKT